MGHSITLFEVFVTVSSSAGFKLSKLSGVMLTLRMFGTSFFHTWLALVAFSSNEHPEITSVSA